MSGFGSFGAQSPFGSSGFGGSQPNNPPTGGFGGFPMPPGPSPSFFGSTSGNFGFGSPPPSSSSSIGSSLAFGSSSNMASSTGDEMQDANNSSTTTGFPQNVQPFGMPAANFGSTVFGSSNTSSFGSPSGFGSTSSFNTQPALPFGTAGAAQPSTASNPFATGSNTTTASSIFAAPAFPPSAPSTTPFGNPLSFATPAAAPQPFGSPPAFGSSNPFAIQATAASSASGMSFGVSSNIAPSTFPGFGHADDADMLFTSNSPTPIMGSPMHHFSDSEEMADEAPSRDNLPFGTPVQMASSTTFGGTWLSSSSTMNNTMVRQPESLSPIQEEEVTSGQPSADAQIMADEEKHQDELARLRAKIEEKKKKLAQRRKMETESKPLNADARPFVPGRKESSAEGTSSKSPLPDDLRSKAGASAPATEGASIIPRESEREALENAVSLVGTCPYMCPDEELLRRQTEGDIQLLELTSPGKLHPKDWTLRDTAVKRFRRSAADYKLDVPEWIRPPDVLEKTCGYLEEWVMERDRQGPDERFPGGNTPPPLEVYQFIWDRTRMIRKDFILQNFVGTGGQCDARAVRCHERIARWHAMCEHQLSHITEFVTMQSQQNIQELGQTMKTLNQYYDDSMRRSMVEVPDEQGHETRSDLSAVDHGCSIDTVQGGRSPVDYDGTNLSNEATEDVVKVRLIGKNAILSPNHGTAEPEMRGLYILLTIDNDGGMEVLKYVSRLYQQRPEIYHSKPVALALEIYKAKRDLNYAKFFGFLRSQSTPYLFGCIMFMYVETMRKAAFKIMSRTFGGRSKDKDEPIYDAYPLRTLMNLLCFEDLDEARDACQHYGITVKATKVKTSSGDRVEEIVFWRHSSFQDPKDPDKGTVIPLRPRKMVRVIESKLKGATRLAVCRGQVSGIGATLGEGVLSASVVGGTLKTDIDSDERWRREKEILEQRKIEQEKRAREEEIAEQQRRENHRRESERREQERLLQNRLEEEERARKIEERKEEIRREQKRMQEEQDRIRAEVSRQKAREKAEEEERKKQRDIERMETIRLEQERQHREELVRREEMAKELVRVKEEQARRRVAEEEERLRREAEEKKFAEELRRKDEEKRRLQAEERSLQEEWTKRIDFARKKILWRRLINRLPIRQRMVDKSKESLSAIDLARSPHTLAKRKSLGLVPYKVDAHESSIRRTLEEFLRQSPKLDLSDRIASTLLQTIVSNWTGNQTIADENSKTTTFLFRIGLFGAIPTSIEERPICDLLRMWICFCFRSGCVVRVNFEKFEVRVSFFDGAHHSASLICDGAIIALPGNGLMTDSSLEETASRLNASLDHAIPRIVLVLDEQNSQSGACVSERKLTRLFQTDAVLRNESSDRSALESFLHSGCSLCATVLSAQPPQRLARLSLQRLCYNITGKALWRKCNVQTNDDVVRLAKSCLKGLSVVLDELQTFEVLACGWPSPDFSANGVDVEDYFGKGLNLPLDWRSRLYDGRTQQTIHDISAAFNGSLMDTVERLLAGAPPSNQAECMVLLERRCGRRALQLSFLSRIERDETEQVCSFIFLPPMVVDEVIERAVARAECVLGPQFRHSGGSPSISSLTVDTLAGGGIESHAVVELQNAYLGKRQRHDLTIGDDRGSEALTEFVGIDPEISSSGRKRPRGRVFETTRDLLESMNFSRRLEALVDGRQISDMVVGTTTLSSLLRGAPNVEIP